MKKFLTLKIYDQEGKESGGVKLDPEIFDVKISEPLVHQIVVAQQANRRVNLAHTKTRGEVRGGGRKPWRQKGTGRARHGSIRSPLWRGGGVTFGPSKIRNFSKKVNKKAKRQATRMILTDKAQNKEITVLDQLKIDNYKTKDLLKVLTKLKKAENKCLLILPKPDQKIYRSAQNLKNIETILADSLNVISLLKFDHLIIVQDSLKKITQTFSK